MQNLVNRIIWLMPLTVLAFAPSIGAENWPGFRGPKTMGVSAEKNLPIKWSEKDNLAWKTPLPGPGASSPIVWGDRAFVTCWSGYADGGNELGDIKKLRRHLVCLDRKTGRTLWTVEEPAKQPELPWGRAVSQHGYATSTPVTDGKTVYVFYGKSGVFAYDFNGKKLWHAETGKYLNNFGSGASPVLWRNLVIVNAVVEGGGLIALDKNTGRRVWRKKLFEDFWTTPVIVDAPGGRQELVVLMPAVLYGFDPATGKELWQCSSAEPDYVSANPVVRDGVIYVMGSGSKGRLCMAVRAGGSGDVTKSHILWKQEVGGTYTSPILAGPHLYFFSSLAYCLNTKNGEVVYRERLPGLGREYGSPVTADGKIYLFTRTGTGYVLAAGGKFQPLARNELGDNDSFTASPAVSHGQIFVRTNSHLYCIGKTK